MARGITKRSFLDSVRGIPPTAQNLRVWWSNKGPQLSREGVGFIDHPRDPAVVMPDGTHIDVIQDAGGERPQWQWLVKEGETAPPDPVPRSWASSAPTEEEPDIPESLGDLITPTYRKEKRQRQQDRFEQQRHPSYDWSPGMVDPVYGAGPGIPEDLNVTVTSPEEIQRQVDAAGHAEDRAVMGAPPNMRVDPDNPEKWEPIDPDDPAFDPTWGGEEDETWVEDRNESVGWFEPITPPSRDPDSSRDRRETPDPGTPSRQIGGYMRYGMRPTESMDVDLGYLRDAPAFEYEGYEPFSYAPYETPAPFTHPQFSAPTAQEVLTGDPGYQFRMDEGRRALEAAAAARGTLRSGGTLQNILDYGQEKGSEEYQKAYQRRLRSYETDLGASERAYAQNLQARQDAYERQRQNALQSYQMDTDRRYQMAKDRYEPQFMSWQSEQGARGKAAAAKYGRQWDAYQYAQPSATRIFEAGLAPRGVVNV
jgi:hypothetical protein